jgi:hypothetical protein
VYFDEHSFLNWNALPLSTGFPHIFSASTAKAASVGSPTLTKSPSVISILELLLTVHPTAKD